MIRFFCTTFFVLVVIFKAFPQVSFEPGYFINQEGDIIECLIENKEWRNNPSKFRYRYAEKSPVKKADIFSVKEFGIRSQLKYIRADVEIDRSSSNLESLSKSKNPEYQTETLFLQVLVEGKANLYAYTDKNLNRFFLKLDNSEITQLVYKKYMQGNYMNENRHYLKQLSSSMSCQGMSTSENGDIRYSKKQLIEYFVNYNNCEGQESIIFQKKKSKSSHFTLKGGLMTSQIEIIDSFNGKESHKFEPGIGYAINLEFEHIMSFNKNKWSFIIEPGFNTITIPGDIATNPASLKYSAISLPIGLRHSIYFNKSSRIMLNLLGIYEFAIDSEVTLGIGAKMKVEMNSHLAVGLGFKHKRFLIEGSFCPGYDILSQYVFFKASKSDLRFNLGYTLF